MNKKYKIIISICVVFALLTGLTVYALINNDEPVTNESPDTTTSNSESGDIDIGDITFPDVYPAPDDKTSHEPLADETHISIEENQDNVLYKFELDDINRTKNGIEVGQTITIGDYTYTYGYTSTRPGGTKENGGLIPQDTGYDFGWHVRVKDGNTEKSNYEPICEYIFEIPVTDVTYLFANCDNITQYPSLPRSVKIGLNNWMHQG